MIVGTAGHIDHGKSSLVKAITGVDPDRLKEEKARGITIELGFAYWPRPAPTDGIIGFVDVPGHERLVHTMLAGAAGIEFVLLVVAADDGVMPQTREHLAILDLLGLDRGLVVLTKCDLVDADRQAQVCAQIREATAGTGLAEAPILPVSVVRGDGLGELEAALDAACRQTRARSRDGRFRLAVDRVFSLAGAGTVVTGTVLSGEVAVGDPVIVSPRALTARVRSIHAQGQRAQTAGAGDRAAIALVGPDISTIAVTRGAIVQDPSLHAPTRRIDVRIDVLASERRPLAQWMPVHLHHAASATPARMVMLSSDSLAPGTSGLAQVVLEAPIAACAGDRFIVRDIAATRTIGGGVILDPSPPERRRRTPERLAQLAALQAPDTAQALALILDCAPHWIDLNALLRGRAAPADAAQAGVERLSLVTLAAGPVRAVMLPERWARYREDLVAQLAAHHREHPDEPGIGQERLRLGLTPRLPAPVFATLLARLLAAGDIRLERAWVRLPGHEVRLSPQEERDWEVVRPHIAGDGRFRPPRVRDIAKAEGLEEARVRHLFKIAARLGDVDELAHDHFFLASAVIEMADVARALAADAADGRFAVVAFRDRLDNGRKVAIQVLEFFDAQGLTMRRGDVRRINPHRANLFTAGTDGDAGA